MIKMYEAMDSKDNYIYSLEALVYMHDKEPKNYSYVSQRLVCPHCFRKVIRLTINDTMAEIKSKRFEHSETCDYYGISLKQNIIRKRIKSGEGFDVELEAIAKNQLIKNNLPKKNLQRLLSDDDYDIYKVFYGNVVIKNAHSKDDTRYLNYSFKAPKGDMVNVTIHSGCFANLEKHINYLNDNIDQKVTIFMLGIMREYDDYNNIEIKHSGMFKIEGVDYV